MNVSLKEIRLFGARETRVTRDRLLSNVKHSTFGRRRLIKSRNFIRGRYCQASCVYYIEVVIHDSRRSGTFLRRAGQWQHATAISRSVNDDGMSGSIGLSPFPLSFPLSLSLFCLSPSLVVALLSFSVLLLKRASYYYLRPPVGCVVYNSYTCTFGRGIKQCWMQKTLIKRVQRKVLPLPGHCTIVLLSAVSTPSVI